MTWARAGDGMRDMRAISDPATKAGAACTKTGATHADASAYATRAQATASAATASVRGIYSHRDCKHTCYDSSASLLEHQHVNLLMHCA
jgi:hypothetical protein